MWCALGGVESNVVQIGPVLSTHLCGNIATDSPVTRRSGESRDELNDRREVDFVHSAHALLEQDQTQYGCA